MSDRADRADWAGRSGPPGASPFAAARYDVAVAGGGAVGAALACALADSGSSVLLADPSAAGATGSPAGVANAPSPAVAASPANPLSPPASASHGTTQSPARPRHWPGGDRADVPHSHGTTRSPAVNDASPDMGDAASAESQGDHTVGRVSHDPPAFAPRPLALSLASERVLASLGVWEALAGQATPIESIHVSEAGRFGATRLEAAECGIARFGSVVPAGALGAALRDAVARRPAIHRTGGHVVDAGICAGAVVSRAIGSAGEVGGVGDAGGAGYVGGAEGTRRAVLLGARTSRPHCVVETAQTGREDASFAFTASLLVIADGGRSELREALGISATVRDYRQRAIASVVEARAPRERTAFERFTPDGPVALLPMGGSRYGLVWCCGGERADRLAGLSERAFTEALDAVFAGRFGGFASAGERTVFGLRLARADTVVAERVALVGNAANHLHPVAGQGFNLGMRDVACLAEVVAAGRREGCAPGDVQVLERYRRWRAPDHARVARFTDALVDVFCNCFSPAAPFRAPALAAFDLVPPLKRALARRATGFAGKAPRLALGSGP